MKGGNDIQFSSINREEYANLEDFLKQKRIKVKSVNTEESIISYAELDEELGEDDEDDLGSSRKRRRTDADEDTVMDDVDDVDDESRK